MCGIAGFYGSREISPEVISNCLALMKHRGPDNQAYRHFQAGNGQNAYLLHSRLNIIDLDHRSDQPFQVNSKWMVFNGELYNYKEIKAELEALGRKFHTKSDTEVFLQAIDCFGVDVLDKCEGMWGFALFDEADGSLILCRDRFGEKPVYIYTSPEGLYFGSEIKFIAALCGRRFEINYSRLYSYMVNGYRSLFKKDETFFKDVTLLSPATILKAGTDGGSQTSRYWTFEFNPDDSMTFDEAVAGTRERIIESMRIRLRSDVPLAFCMSGGVDSNSLISIAKTTFDYDVHGFTIVNDDPRYNETDLVRASVEHLNIRHTEIPVSTKDFLPRLRDQVRHHDAPVTTISYYAHWLLMKSMSEQGYRISLSGTGADEFFTGYFDHQSFYLAELADQPAAFNEGMASWNRHIKPVIRNPILQDPYVFINDPERRDHIYLGTKAFSPFLKSNWSEPFSEEDYKAPLLRNRMLNELFHEITPGILHEDDLNAMSFSIENQSPFLDRSLFEFSLTIPTRLMIRDTMAKAVLRESLRGIASDTIVNNRQKMGFNAPIEAFLDTKDPEVRDWMLDDGEIYDHVKKDQMELFLDKDSYSNHESLFLFYFTCSKLFLEEFS